MSITLALPARALTLLNRTQAATVMRIFCEVNNLSGGATIAFDGVVVSQELNSYTVNVECTRTNHVQTFESQDAFSTYYGV